MKKTNKLQKEGGGWGAMQRAAIKHIKGNDFRVYAYLITRANEDGRCWPGVPLIAEETGITERNVRNHLKSLEDDGWIKRYHRTNTSNMYQLFFVDTSAKPKKTEANNSDSETKSDRGSKTDRSLLSKIDRSGVSKSDRSPLSKSDSQTDQLTDHNNKPINSAVPVSVVSPADAPTDGKHKLSPTERIDFKKLWEEFGQEGEAKRSAESVYAKYAGIGDPIILTRFQNILDDECGTYMTNQMNQIYEEYQAEEEVKNKQKKSKSRSL